VADYHLSHAADRELAEIYTYTFQTFGQAQADRYADQLLASARLVADFPLLGRDYTTGDGVEYRRYGSGRHFLFYRLRDDGDIVIDHFIHQARDFDQLL